MEWDIGNAYVSLFSVPMLGGLVLTGTGLPTGALDGEVRWWNYLYSTLVCVMCLIISLVGGAMFGKTTVFIFAVRFLFLHFCSFFSLLTYFIDSI